jgi:hypothetical protein
MRGFSPANVRMDPLTVQAAEKEEDGFTPRS